MCDVLCCCVDEAKEKSEVPTADNAIKNDVDASVSFTFSFIVQVAFEPMTFTVFLFSLSQSTASRRDSEHVPIHRKCTDVFFLVLIIAFVVILVSLISLKFNLDIQMYMQCIKTF